MTSIIEVLEKHTSDGEAVLRSYLELDQEGVKLPELEAIVEIELQNRGWRWDYVANMKRWFHDGQQYRSLHIMTAVRYSLDEPIVGH